MLPSHPPCTVSWHDHWYEHKVIMEVGLTLCANYLEPQLQPKWEACKLTRTKKTAATTVAVRRLLQAYTQAHQVGCCKAKAHGLALWHHNLHLHFKALLHCSFIAHT